MTTDLKEPSGVDIRLGGNNGNVTLLFEDRELNLQFRDRTIDGRKLLRDARLEPPDDYVLIELTSPGTRSSGLDEDIDLTTNLNKRFRAFLSDRIFTFTVVERGYEWGAANISEAELRLITGVPADADLVLEREDQPDEVIAKGSTLDLAERGTEHISIRKRPDSFEVIVVYNGQKKPLKVTLCEQIKDVLARAIALFGSLPNPHTLSLFTADSGELKDEATVKEAGLTPGEKVLLRPSTVKAG